MLRCLRPLRRDSQACLLNSGRSLLGAVDCLWPWTEPLAAECCPTLQRAAQVCRRLTTAAAGFPPHANAQQRSIVDGELPRAGPIQRKYEDMVAHGTLRHDAQQTGVAARLDALLAQMHSYCTAVTSYRDGVQQYKVVMC